MNVAADALIAAEAQELAASATAELQELVDISSPSGDIDGAERALAVCIGLLPDGASIDRPDSPRPTTRPT